MTSRYTEVGAKLHLPLVATDKVLNQKTDVSIRYTYRLYTLQLNKLEYRILKTASFCKQSRKYAIDLIHAYIREYVTHNTVHEIRLMI